MIEYIIENKEWIFSGVGVLAITLLISSYSRKQQLNKKQQSSNNITIRGSMNNVEQLGSKEQNNIEIDGNMNNVNQP